MKRLPLLGLILALAASCGSSIENDEQGLACYDTGSGVKCVPVSEVPANTTAICVDKDGEMETSQSSTSGPSLSDNDTSVSSDSPVGAVVAPTGGGDDDDDGGDSSSSTEDPSGDSTSTEEHCGGAIAKTGGDHDSNSGEDGDGDGHSDSSSDADGDGTSDEQDCDCLDMDDPAPTPPGGEGGPIIIN